MSTPTPRSRTRDTVESALEGVTAQVQSDVRALRTIPGGPLVVAGAVLLTTAVFALLRFGIRDVYTESLVFLGLVFVLGLLGWTVGVAVVVLVDLFDLGASAATSTMAACTAAGTHVSTPVGSLATRRLGSRAPPHILD